MFATAPVMIALVSLAVIALMVLIVAVYALWRHRVALTLSAAGVLSLVIGIALVTVMQADWANHGVYGINPTWGLLDDRLPMTFFVIAAVLLVSDAILWFARFLRTRAKRPGKQAPMVIPSLAEPGQ